MNRRRLRRDRRIAAAIARPHGPRTVGLILVAGLVLLAVCAWWKRPVEVVKAKREAVTIDERISYGSDRVWRFGLPSVGGEDFKLRGWFDVTSGGNRQIDAYVVEATQYAKFQRGTKFYALYSRSGVISSRFEFFRPEGEAVLLHLEQQEPV